MNQLTRKGIGALIISGDGTGGEVRLPQKYILKEQRKRLPRGCMTTEEQWQRRHEKPQSEGIRR